MLDRHRVRFVLACALVFATMTSASAAPNGERDFYTDGSWVVTPGPVPIDGTLHHEHVGRPLFTQALHATTDAVMPNDFTVATPPGLGSNSPGSIQFAAGSTFSQFSVSPRRLAFCDLNVTRRDRGASWGRRLCLLDTNNDGVFDAQYWAVHQEPFAPALLFTPAEVSIPYSLRDEGTQNLMSVGLVVNGGHTFGYRIEFVVIGPERPVVLYQEGPHAQPPQRAFQMGPDDDASGLRFWASELPLTLRIGSARIEITSIENEVVAFHIISGFAEAPMRLPYNEHLPINSSSPGE